MLLLNRLAPFLEHEQPADQLGFRRGLGIDDAMVVLENVCGKCLAWESDIWFASLDLQKAFDRIEHDSCFKQCKHKEFQTRTFKCCAGCTLDNPELFTAAIVFSTSHVE